VVGTAQVRREVICTQWGRQSQTVRQVQTRTLDRLLNSTLVHDHCEDECPIHMMCSAV
jgi:hypothetical protein